jgi:hypothetical protein
MEVIGALFLVAERGNAAQLHFTPLVRLSLNSIKERAKESQAIVA